jgi:excisionase family DNA binding protein
MAKNSAAIAIAPSPPALPDVPMLTIADVENRLQVSRPFIYELLNSGELKSVMQGNRRYITQRQLDDYVRHLEKEGAPLPRDQPNNKWRPLTKKAAPPPPSAKQGPQYGRPTKKQKAQRV